MISRALDVADVAEPVGAVVARFELRSGDGIGAANVAGVGVPGATVGRVPPAAPVVHRLPQAGDAGSADRPAKRARPSAGADAEAPADHPVIVIAGGVPAGRSEADLLRQLVSVAETRLAELADRSSGAAERPALSPRERECLQWTAAGKTTWEIAGILAISTNTVDGYIAAATRKLGAVNRTQAAVVALRRALID